MHALIGELEECLQYLLQKRAHWKMLIMKIQILKGKMT